MKLKGLSSAEAEAKLREFGPNKISHQEEIDILGIIIRQLKSPLIYILLFATGLSIFLEEFTDAFFILLVVMLNTALAFTQEYQAENTLEKLQARISKNVKVIRDNKRILISVESIVPDDLILLEPGVKIPADGEVLESMELQIDESLLTGESVPVEKNSEKELKLFMGTLVVNGLGTMKVTKTGDQTKYGEIAQKLSEPINQKTQTQKRLESIGTFISIFVLAISLLVIGVGLFNNMDLGEIILVGVTLAVSAIPEGLVITYTVVLALSMRRLLKKQAIVKNLPAAETLGNLDILCIDKTGTLTLGQMKVDEIITDNLESILYALASTNNDVNFIDLAVKEYIIEAKSEEFLQTTQNKRKQLFPFSSKLKYTGGYDGEFLNIAGSPEIIFSVLQPDQDTSEFKSIVNKLATEGKRIIAVAGKKIESKKITRDDVIDLKFLGLVVITDPVRETAKESFQIIKNSGIDIKVITGDLKETAMGVLSKLGVILSENEIISGKELNMLIGTSEFDTRVMEAKLFYRTTPNQKLEIVKSLRNQKKSIGMMGDGVNDAPALKHAEIGIGVDNATDVSKEASDIVLLSTDFQTILEAVKEGRNIFINIRKIFINLFSDTLSESFLIILAILARTPLPLLPLHILWINLIVDGIPGISLAFEKSKKNLLNKEFKPKDRGFFDFWVIIPLSISSFIGNVLYFSLYMNFLDRGMPVEEARTIVFSIVALSSLFFIYSAKTLESSIFENNIFDNPVINGGVILGIIFILAGIYLSPLNTILELYPLALSQALFIIAISFFDLSLNELAKFLGRLFKRLFMKEVRLN